MAAGKSNKDEEHGEAQAMSRLDNENPEVYEVKRTGPRSFFDVVDVLSNIESPYPDDFDFCDDAGPGGEYERDAVDADEVTTAAPEGAELEWYEKEGLGGGNYPFNRAFYDVDEMQFVKGMDLVAQYKPNWRDYFTVKSQGALDINDAPANVIAVAAGILEMDDIGGSDYSEKVLEIQEFLEGPSGRNGEDGIKDTEDDVNIDTGLLIQELIRLDPPSPEQLSSRFTSNGNTLRIISTGIKGDYRRQIAVVLRNRGTRPTIISREEIFVK